LIDKGESVSLAALVERVRKRDERDMNRKVSPMVPAANAILLDSTGMSIDEVLQKVVDHVTANGIDLPQ
jgi:cytidylate kinase